MLKVFLLPAVFPLPPGNILIFPSSVTVSSLKAYLTDPGENLFLLSHEIFSLSLYHCYMSI